VASRSASSRATAPRRTTLVWVELETRSTCTVVLLTLSPVVVRLVRRCLLVLLAWATTVTLGSYTLTVARAVR